MRTFDLIVIGGGTGLDIANAAAQHGLEVALIEKDRLGGTCLNRGCIPSKLIIHSADILETIKNAHKFGIDVKEYAIDFRKIMERANGITDLDSDEIKNNLMQSSNPQLFSGECKFIGYKQISVNLGDNADKEIILTAPKILIAAGTKPSIPTNVDGLDNSGYITSNEALRLRTQPLEVTFIGGGYITCELAHFFGSLGTKINIIQRNNLLVPNEDIEISKKITSIFNEKYSLYLGYVPISVSKVKDNGAALFNITATNKRGNKIDIHSDQLIVATGRIPNTFSLGLQKTGVSINQKGFIKVNEYLETDVPGIYAIGDVIGRYQFKHSANMEAQYVFRNILNSDKQINNPQKISKVDYTAMPHAIFTHPQIAGVGYTEQILKKNNTQYLKSIYPYINTGMGRAIEDNDGFVKFLVDKTNNKILGCHIIGTDASTLIHEVLVTLRTGDGTIDSILNTIHIHPALSEVIARAANNFS